MTKTKKIKRHSGRKHIASVCEDCPDEVYYSDWNDWRDGFRAGTHNDGKMLDKNVGSTCECWWTEKHNLKAYREKQAKLEKRRRKRKKVVIYGRY
jgi:hypothetical protein